MKITRPAWLEVNLDNMKHNIQVIQREIADHTQVFSIVKADGYSFGARKIVEAVHSQGVTHFGVATPNEAMYLRKHYPDIKILILGYTPSELLEDMIINDIQMGVSSLEAAKEINQVARKQDKKAVVQIKIDSGMNRIGFKPTEESVLAIEEISKMENVEIYGMFTHFAVADTDEEYTRYQFKNYCFMRDRLAEIGIHPLLHVSNSHATMKYRDFDLDFVRPGIVQYGTTEEDEAGKNFDVRFIGALKAKVAHVKTVPAGEGISYGLTYTTDKETKIATLPLGYADGIERNLSNKIDVLIGGKRCPQIGRICMDQLMVDVTGIDVVVGDEAVLIGKQGDQEITIDEVAKLAGEIPTSYVTHFNKRLPKVYIENGEVVEILDQVQESNL